ncbi:DEAD/DEAH box helicase [Anaerotignum propionicum]|uniref:Superfamily II DNA and RNA helicase n=1 Tax=Anaerotignum propionicum DSM 1682 TaxID=991789 RepID=A0AA94HWG5_ANAPI|nr:DEAD/DEAH box helicase [Anaerotignum propionicum]SHE34019.1 Superfamily II DNA and RNA helicase [[Clostridium] propionicum DSM 1682] [Anaerotignum propionicum DSM 1682]
MENGFEKLGLSSVLTKALAKQGIETPTEIQKHMIPYILSGKDVIGRSETGSGKTLAYLLPIFQRLDLGVKGAQAIILTPTHELAAQVFHQAELLEENSGLDIGCMLIIGSAGPQRQLERLKEKPRILIGSTGRILDFIKRKKVPAHLVKTIVLDEGDRLLEDGNFEDVASVVKSTLKERQIVLLSASVDEETRERSKKLMKEGGLFIEAKTGSLVPQGISHYYILATQRDKFLQLRKILAGEKPQRAIVFLNNPENIEVTVDKLCFHGIKAAGIYGKAAKLDRKNALEDFRNGRANVLVASDIGARGLDIEGVTHIINMDVPEEPSHYLHRAGRCGRKGTEGTTITLVTPYERRWVHKYEKVWGLRFVQKEMAFGKLVDSTMTKKDLDKPQKTKKTKDEEFGERAVVWADKPKKETKVTHKETVKGKDKKEPEKEELGFFAKKAKKQAEKAKNKLQNQKK